MKCNRIKLCAWEIIFKTKNCQNKKVFYCQKVKDYQTEQLYQKVKTYLSIRATQSNRKTFLFQIVNKLSNRKYFSDRKKQSKQQMIFKL